MEKVEKKVDFDLSVLSLEELVKVYENITTFLQFLDEKKIVQEEKVEK
jgi:hypothetical protein